MVKKRIIPVILLKNGVIVQSRLFNRYQALGSPTAAVERLSSWESDELIYLDISKESRYDLKRDDLNHPKFDSLSEIIKLVSKKCMMPLTFGGGIRTLQHVEERIKNGADKIAINTMAVENARFITETAKIFGSQCIVVSIDVKKEEDGTYWVYKSGKEPRIMDPALFARITEEAGAGEILLNSIDRDGTGRGFDLTLISKVCDAVKIPVIALGGAGTWEHFEEVLSKTAASAVAAANIFQHSENSVFNCRSYLYSKGFNVRKPSDLSLVSKNL